MLPKSFMTEQSMLTLQVLQQRLDALMLRDKQRFSRRLHGVKKVKNPDAQQAIFQTMAKEIEQAATQVALREAARPSITYPQNLPVSQKKQDILEAVRDHQVVIVAGETGSGKTTQLPKICSNWDAELKDLLDILNRVVWRRAPSLTALPKSCKRSLAAASAIKFVSAIMSVATPWSN